MMLDKIWGILSSVDEEALAAENSKELDKIKEVRDIINSKDSKKLDEFRTWRIRYGKSIEGIAKSQDESKSEYYDFGAYSKKDYHDLGMKSWMTENDKHKKLIGMDLSKNRQIFHPYILKDIEFIKTTERPDLITKRKGRPYIIHEEFKVRTHYTEFNKQKHSKSAQVERFNNIDRAILGYHYYMENNGYKAIDVISLERVGLKKEFELTDVKKTIASGGRNIKLHADSVDGYLENNHLEEESSENTKVHFVVDLSIAEIAVFDKLSVTYSHIASSENNLWRLAVEHESELRYAFAKGVDAITYITRRKEVTSELTIDEVVFRNDAIAITILKEEFEKGIIQSKKSELEYLELKPLGIDFTNLYQVEVINKADSLIKDRLLDLTDDYIKIDDIINRIEGLNDINSNVSVILGKGALDDLKNALNYEKYLSYFSDEYVRRYMYTRNHKDNFPTSTITEFINKPELERKDGMMRVHKVGKKTALKLFPEIVEQYNEIEVGLYGILKDKQYYNLLSEDYYIFSDYQGEAFVKDKDLLRIIDNKGSQLSEVLRELESNDMNEQSKLTRDLISMKNARSLMALLPIETIMNQILLIGLSTIDSEGMFMISDNSKGAETEIRKGDIGYKMTARVNVVASSHKQGYSGFVKLYVIPKSLVETFIKM